MLGKLRKKGIVVGLSGGVDSSVVVALAVKALGPQHVFGVLMPDRDSSADSLRLGRQWARSLGIETALGLRHGPAPGWRPHPGAGRGLAGVRERVSALGGTLAVDSRRPGFRVEARLPDRETP